MELIKYQELNSEIPMKAIPEEKLNAIIVDVFIEWLSDLLSLTDEVSAQRLAVSLPAIKQHCWSMGFAEIKKMFEMYCDNQLSIKPLPNYFDRILFGKIVEAYKQQKPRKKIIQPKMKQKEIDFIMTEAVDRIQKDFQQNKRITESCHHVYDHLFEQGLLPTDKEYKIDIFIRATEIREQELIHERNMDLSNRKGITKLLNNLKTDNQVIIIAKRLVLEDYFKTLKPIKKH